MKLGLVFPLRKDLYCHVKNCDSYQIIGYVYCKKHHDIHLRYYDKKRLKYVSAKNNAPYASKLEKENKYMIDVWETNEGLVEEYIK